MRHCAEWHKLCKMIFDFGLDSDPSLQPVLDKCRSLGLLSDAAPTTSSHGTSLAPFPQEVLWCNLTMLFDYVTDLPLSAAPELAPAKERLAELTAQRRQFYATAGITPPAMISSFIQQFL